MKRSIKILLITTVALVGVMVAVAVLISPVTKYYIEKHSKEIIGRQINLDKLSFNIFNGTLRVQNIQIMESNDTAKFFSVEEIYVNMKLLPLIKNKVSIQEVMISAPRLNVYQNGANFNFDDLLLRFASTDTTAVKQDTISAWEVGIDDIHIKQGYIYYEDQLIGATWGVDNLDVSIPGIYFKDKTDVGVLFNFINGGSLGLNLAYNMDNSDYDLGIDLNGLALNDRLPYVQQSLNSSGMNGFIWAKLHLNGNLGRIVDMYLDGTIDLSKFSLEDHNGDVVAKVDSLHIGLNKGSLRHNQFYFSRLYLLGMEGKFDIYKDGTNNIAKLIKEQPTPIATVETNTTDTIIYEPLDLRIEDLEIVKGSVKFRDNTRLKPFEYTLSNIRLKTGFDMNKPNKVVIDAQIQKTGQARIRWEGSISGLDNHNLQLSFTNIEIKDFSPYCEHYTAYPLTNGKLSFRSHNIIKNRQLIGTNHLDMFDPKADKKIKGMKSEFDIPLRLGLYVMKDRNGLVKIDLPVNGSIDDPNFSYRKIIFKTIGNVLLKVITSPFSFLSGGDNLESIDIDPLQGVFSSEQYSKLDKLAKMIGEKPEIKLVLTQKINYVKTLKTLEQLNLKMSYYNHLRQADTTTAYTPLTMLDYEHIQKLNLKSDGLIQFADSLIRLQGEELTKMNEAQKAELLYKKQSEQQILTILEHRNAALKRYMIEMQGVSEASFKVMTMPIEELKNYIGKDRYTIGVEVEGEATEVSNSPDDIDTARKTMGLEAENAQQLETKPKK